MRATAALLAFLLFVPLAAEADPVWGDPATAKVRPGASLGGYCTLNFVFTDAQGRAYIGTAAHCTSSVGERVKTGSLTFGSVVYDSDKAAGADTDVDFSLIRIDAEDVATTHPRVLGWGGPTGVVPGEELVLGDEVGVYGYGLVVGSTPTTRQRSGYIIDTDAKYYRADMAAVNGDSGAPLVELDTGRAAGIISHYGFYTTDEGPIMPFILAELGKAGLGVTLATDP